MSIVGFFPSNVAMADSVSFCRASLPQYEKTTFVFPPESPSSPPPHAVADIATRVRAAAARMRFIEVPPGGLGGWGGAI